MTQFSINKLNFFHWPEAPHQVCVLLSICSR